MDIDLPSVEGQAKITVKNIRDDFSKQLPDNFSTLLEAFVLIAPRCVRVTCRTPRAMEEFWHSGLTYNSQALVIRPCKSAKWVSVSRLGYGIPDEVIRESLHRYGPVIQVKMDSYRGLYIGTHHVLMDISSPIPSRILIAGHWCHIFYQGQIPMCFLCHQTGHAQKECSVRQGATVRAHNHQNNDANEREPASRANPDNHSQLVAPAQANAVQSVTSHSPAVSTTPQTYATITADDSPPPQTTTIGDGHSAAANVDPNSNAPKERLMRWMKPKSLPILNRTTNL